MRIFIPGFFSFFIVLCFFSVSVEVKWGQARNRLHPMSGDMIGRYSIRVTGNWRITFRFENGDVYDVNLEDYHG